MSTDLRYEPPTTTDAIAKARQNEVRATACVDFVLRSSERERGLGRADVETAARFAYEAKRAWLVALIRLLQGRLS